MTRMTLLASVATLVAAPAFAQSNASEDGSDQTMQNGEQTAQTEQNGADALSQADGGEGSGMGRMPQYASGTMGSNELENMIRTSRITGGDIYTAPGTEWTDEEWANTEIFDEVRSDWEDIGNITDVVFSPDGRRVGLVVSHGGFLDIADDTVLLTMDELRRIRPTDGVSDNFNYVTRLSSEELQQMPEVEETWWW